MASTERAYQVPAAVLLAVVLYAAGLQAQTPLPALRTEPVGGGSVFFIKNTGAQPLTAYLIELVGYPGSSYSLWQDEVAEPLAPGAERRIQVTNMTVGAVPDYVKVRAAIYADGSMAGIPEKAAQLVERRRTVLQTTRELIARLEKGSADAAVLKEWAASLPPEGRARVMETIAKLGNRPAVEVVAELRAWEKAAAASKPAL